MKQRPDSGKPRLFASRAMMAARAVLAVTLLLTLVAGSIAWSAAGSGPLCTLACCAGTEPHGTGATALPSFGQPTAAADLDAV